MGLVSRGESTSAAFVADGEGLTATATAAGDNPRDSSADFTDLVRVRRLPVSGRPMERFTQASSKTPVNGGYGGSTLEGGARTGAMDDEEDANL